VRYELVLYDSLTDKRYAPRIELESNKVAIDYGIVLADRNPFSQDKRALVVAGSFGYGTWGGIRLVTSKQFLGHPTVKKGKSVECLFEVDVTLETPQDTRLVVLRELGEAKESATSHGS
jgi:hypothetical protein